MFVCRFSIEICLNYSKLVEGDLYVKLRKELDVDEWDEVNLIVG